MAQKRMIDKKISVSEQVANLPIEAQLIFTWSIPHADDLGLLPHSSRTLKAMIVPMLELSIDMFNIYLNTIVNQKLFVEFEYKGEKYYYIQKFTDHQTLKKDRKPHTYLPDIESWEEVESIGFQMEDIGNLREVKRSEEKIREDIDTENTLTFLDDIPQEVVTQLSEKYKINPAGIKSKATDLKLYCQQKGKKYKNYRAFLENALRKDKQQLQQKFPYVKVEAPPSLEEITPEQRAKNAEMAKQIREGLTKKLKMQT
jgi:hypothetical protein